MKITCASPYMSTVRLDSLKLGECFLFEGRVGMIASRNGHDFPMDLETGTEFYQNPPARPWIPHDTPPMLNPNAEVVRVKTELIYQIVP